MQLYTPPGCPTETGGPSGVPILFAADTAEVKPIQIVPVFVDFAVIVHPVAFVPRFVDSNCTGVPAVVTVVEPCPPGKADTAKSNTARTIQSGTPRKRRLV